MSTNIQSILQSESLPEPSPPTKGRGALRDIFFYLVTSLTFLMDAPIDFPTIT